MQPSHLPGTGICLKALVAPIAEVKYPSIMFDMDGTVQTRLGGSGSYSGDVSWYHDLAVDAEKCIYVGDILNNRIQKFRRID